MVKLSMRRQFPILVSRTVETRKFKLLRNETCFGAGNLYKDLFSIYLQPRVLVLVFRCQVRTFIDSHTHTHHWKTENDKKKLRCLREI